MNAAPAAHPAMAVRGLVAVDDLQGGARRWAVPAMVAPCLATAVLTAVVLPMPNLGVMASVIANDALHGMESGTSHEVVTGPVTALVSVPVIDRAIGSRSGLVSVSVIAPLIDPVIELENVSVIARKSGSATAPVPSTEIRTPPARALQTNAQGLDVFAIATIGTPTAVAPGMSGANRPSAPDLALTRLVLSLRCCIRPLRTSLIETRSGALGRLAPLIPGATAVGVPIVAIAKTSRP